MAKKFLFILLALTTFTSLHAVDFTYKDITYTVLDEQAKTVTTKKGYSSQAGNTFEGELILPEKVYNGDTEYILKQIGQYGFNNVTSVTIPSSVEIINQNAFYSCNLTSVTIEDSSTKIDLMSDAFNRSPKVYYDLYLGRNYTSGRGIFRGAKSLQIGKLVTSIPDYAFCDLMPSSSEYGGYYHVGSHLSEVIIPSNVTSIGEYAFYADSYYQNIERVIIEDGSNSLEIGSQSFGYIKDIKVGRNIEFNKTTGLFYIFRGVTNAEFTDNVTIIPDDTFKDSSSTLYSVKIGKNCTNIGSNVFTKCQNLRTVVSLNPTPPTIAGSFHADTYKQGRLMVSRGSKSRYMTANYWLDFYDIVELEEESGDSGNTGDDDTPGFSDENITDYVMMEIDQEMNFADLLPSDLTASSWDTSNDDIVDITKKGKAEAYEFGHVYISAKDGDNNVIAVYSVFVCPTVTIVHGDGVLYSHHVIYNSRPKLTLQPSSGYLISSVTHDDTVVLDQLIDHQGTCTYIPEKPITDNTKIYLTMEENPDGGPVTGMGSVISDSGIRFHLSGDYLEIVGATPGEYLKLWNPNGLLFYNKPYHTVVCSDEGVYIAEIQGHRFKFAVKK
ncbi:MAG: leucine-rich repeat protein [Muribaculaceae bacterium]|nr:leucine-rich repeat protein [Muribaculaceae bacterium]